MLSNVAPDISFDIDPATPIQFDITDAGADMVIILPSMVVDPNAPAQLVHDGTDFQPGYRNLSAISAITDGFRYHILPDTGWSSPPVLRLFVADSAGNVLVV